MEWSTFILALLTSLGGTGILIFVIVFFGKKWLSTLIDESVKHEYAKKLEEHKAQLQEQATHSIQQMKAKFQENFDQKATDKALFTKFLDTLPSSGSIEFVNERVLAPFDREKNLEQLYVFCEVWARPEHHFLDDEIDKKRECLYKIVVSFLDYIGINTFPEKGSPGFSAIPEEWVWEQPERYDKTVKKLSNLADQLVTAHEDLIKTARKKLKC